MARAPGLCYNNAGGEDAIMTTPKQIFECVPNVSEGRRPDVLEALRGAVQSVPDVHLLDLEFDWDHNRSVFTFAGPAGAVEEAVYRLADTALKHIDLRIHRGEHPRVGAVDVVPFVPLMDSTVEEAVALAKKAGAELARRYKLPIYLYEEAASAPHRKNLADIRAGEFEGLAEKMATPDWRPDFGPTAPHPSAGATVVGARFFLIAYNLYLDTPDVSVAKKIAKSIRESSGGLPAVKALGFEIKERRLVQVSVNLTDYRKSGLESVFERVAEEALAHGVRVISSEIVGLVPLDALVKTAEFYLRLEKFTKAQILDYRLME